MQKTLFAFILAIIFYTPLQAQTEADLKLALSTVAQSYIGWQKTSCFYFTAGDNESLIVRTKSLYDGALPSGNSVSALNLVKLSKITTLSLYEEKAEELLRAFAAQVTRSPSSFGFLMQAISFSQGPSFEVVIVGKPGASDTNAMVSALYKPYNPEKVVVFRPVKGGDIVGLAPYTEEQEAIKGKATAYVCKNYACKLPTNDPEVMLKNFSE